MSTSLENGKVSYEDWSRFREHLDHLREQHSWRSLSKLFPGKESGWAQAAYQHRSIVGPDDLRHAHGLVRQYPRTLSEPIVMSTQRAEAPAKKGKFPDRIPDSERGRVVRFATELGHVPTLARAMGTTESHVYTMRKTGAVSAEMRDRLAGLHASRNGEPFSPPPPKKKQHRVPAKKRRVTGAACAELIRLVTELGNMNAAAKAMGAAANTLQAARKGNGSVAFLARIRELHGSRNGQPFPNRLRGKAVESPVPAAAPPPKPKPDPATPWNRQAQESLLNAAGLVESAMSEQPKIVRAGMQELVNRISGLIDELAEG